MRKFLLMASFIAMLGGLDAEAQEEVKVVDEEIFVEDGNTFVSKYTYDNQAREILKTIYLRDEGGELTMVGKEETKYDERDRTVLTTSWVYTDGEWEFSEGLSLTYDDENNVVRTDELTQTEDRLVPNGYFETDTMNAEGDVTGHAAFNNDVLVAYDKTEYDAEGRYVHCINYLVNSKGYVPTYEQVIEYEGENHTHTTTWYNDGVADSRKKVTEDKDGNWLYDANYEYDSEKKTLVMTSETTKTYYENGNNKTEEYFSYKDGEIEQGSKSEYVDMSANSKFASRSDVTTWEWDTEKKGWVFDRRNIEGYDKAGNLLYDYTETDGYKYEREEDEDGMVLLQWSMSYDEDLGQWVSNVDKEENAYDENGNQLVEKRYKLNDEGEWEAVVNLTYEYDAHNQVTLKKGFEEESYWDDELGELYNKEYYDYKYEYTYNEAGDETLEVRYTNVDGNYVADRKWVTEYDESGKRTTWRCFGIEGSAEELRWQVDYTYNEAGKIVKEEETDYTGAPNRYTTYEYDERGNLTAERNYSEYEEGEYGLDMVKEYTYDAQGRILSSDEYGEVHQYSYDESGLRTDIEYVEEEVNDEEEGGYTEMVEIRKFVRGFDAEGNVVYEEDYEKSDDDWVPVGTKHIREYDEDGNLVMDEMYDPDGSDWSLAGLVRYEYDEQGREIRKSESRYDFVDEVEMFGEWRIVFTEYDDNGEILRRREVNIDTDYTDKDEDGDVLSEGEWKLNPETGRLEKQASETYVYKTIVKGEVVTAVGEKTVEREADGRTYDLSGREVVGGYRGLAIRDGKLVYIK